MLSRSMVELIRVRTLGRVVDVCQILKDRYVERYAVYASKDDNGDDLYTIKVCVNNARLNRLRRIMKRDIISK